MRTNESRAAAEPSPTESLNDFPALYRHHQGMIRSVVYRIAGASHLDDLVQESFIKVWKAKDRFRGGSSLKTWIYRISVNVALDHLRRNKREIEWNDDIGAPPASDPVASRDLVKRILSSLTPAHRAVLVLNAMEGLSIAEAAQVLGLPEGTVKSQLFYAKKHAQDFLAREGVTV